MKAVSKPAGGYIQFNDPNRKIVIPRAILLIYIPNKIHNIPKLALETRPFDYMDVQQ